MDNWKDKHETMTCKYCMYHINTRCRKYAPTLDGYPAVFPSDWCGDHKLDKDTVIEIFKQTQND